MNVYTPTDLQADICRAIREENRIGRFVTDEDIHAAVAKLVSEPQYKSEGFDLLTATRIRLVMQVTCRESFKKLIEGAAK